MLELILCKTQACSRTVSVQCVEGLALPTQQTSASYLCQCKELRPSNYLCAIIADSAAGGVARRWSGASEAFKSPTSVAALTGALFGRSAKSSAGAVQLTTNRNQRATPEDQV